MDRTIRDQIYDALYEIRRQSPSHKLTAVYLGHDEYFQFVSDPLIRHEHQPRFESPMIYVGAEIIRVDKPNHVGFGWTDGVIKL